MYSFSSYKNWWVTHATLLQVLFMVSRDKVFVVEEIGADGTVSHQLTA